jgi:hypothetical protein
MFSGGGAREKVDNMKCQDWHVIILKNHCFPRGNSLT